MRHIRHLTSSLVITLIVHQFHAPGNVSPVQVCVSPVQVMFHLAANNYAVAYTQMRNGRMIVRRSTSLAHSDPL